MGALAVEALAEPAAADGKPRVRIVDDDDGPGLSPEERERVAQRGQRLDETKPGSGLGLSIVVELARLYGGALTLGTAPIGGYAPSWCCRRGGSRCLQFGPGRAEGLDHLRPRKRAKSGAEERLSGLNFRYWLSYA